MSIGPIPPITYVGPITADVCFGLFNELMNQLRNEGLIRDAHIEAIRYADYGMNGDTLRGWAELNFGLQHDRRINFILTPDELNMEGYRALMDWLVRIEEAIREMFRVHRMSMMAAPSPFPPVDPCEDWVRESSYARLMMNNFMDNSMISGLATHEKQRENADKKSRELFKSVAGIKAYSTLESGIPLPIKGSLGTDYELYRRSVYCIERPDNGTRYCAVVPGVPLHDHLLGIKLMVEHDEPTFLRYANVSHGPAPRPRDHGMLGMFNRFGF